MISPKNTPATRPVVSASSGCGLENSKLSTKPMNRPSQAPLSTPPPNPLAIRDMWRRLVRFAYCLRPSPGERPVPQHPRRRPMRAGQHREALDVLNRSLQVNTRAGIPYLVNLEFIAMARHQLGQSVEARETLEPVTGHDEGSPRVGQQRRECLVPLSRRPDRTTHQHEFRHPGLGRRKKVTLRDLDEIRRLMAELDLGW